MKKSGIVEAGAGNANENGEAFATGVAFVGRLCELAVGAGDWPPVPGARRRRLPGRTRQFGCPGWRRRARRRPVCRPARGRHFDFEPGGLWRGPGGTVTVTVVVGTVVAGAGLTIVVVGVPALPGVLAVSAVTLPAPSTSAAHHASIDVPPSRSARVIATCPIVLLHVQQAARRRRRRQTTGRHHLAPPTCFGLHRHPEIGQVT